MKSAWFHGWNLPDFIMKFAGFHEICLISWNPPDFTMKSTGFHHEIHQISWILDFCFILQNQYRYTVWSTTECCIFHQNQSPCHEICRIPWLWNPPNFTMKSTRFHAWNLPNFTMKSTGFHGIPLNAVFFIRTNTDIHCKSPCHEIRRISWNPAGLLIAQTSYFADISHYACT